MYSHYYRNATLAERVSRRIAMRGEDDCWIWECTIGADGYGVLSFKGRIMKAHRAAYEVFVGPIPTGLNVCHHCDNRVCCNPKHLFVGTNGDNTRDMIAKGRSYWQKKRAAENA